MILKGILVCGFALTGSGLASTIPQLGAFYFEQRHGLGASFLHLSFDEYFRACLQYFLVDRAPSARTAAQYSSVAQWQSIRLLTGGL